MPLLFDRVKRNGRCNCSQEYAIEDTVKRVTFRYVPHPVLRLAAVNPI